MPADRRARAGVAAVLALGLGLGCGFRVYLHVEPRKLADDVWAYLGGGGNSLVVVHGTDAFAADLKEGDFALRQRRLVEDELLRTVRRILITGSETDHWGGLSLYPQVGAVLAHPRTRERISTWLRRHRQPDFYPWTAVEHEVRLVLGEQEVWIRFLGAGYSDGDLVAFVPGLNLVMTGDLFSKGFEPVVDAEAGGRLLGLRRALDAMLAYDFEQVLPGHGPLCARADVVAARDYLAAMEAALRGAVARGLEEDAAVEAGEAALKGFPKQGVLPFRPGRRENLRAMYRELRQPDKSAAP